MKPYLPYNVLLVIAVILTGLMVFYNLAWRQSFAVTVAYQIPGVPQPKAPLVQDKDTLKYADVESSADEEYYEERANDEETLTSVTFPLDLNRATEAELRFIPQVGDVTAQRIIQYREYLGGYKKLEQLKEIKGIGDKSYEQISAYLYVAEEQQVPDVLEDASAADKDEESAAEE